MKKTLITTAMAALSAVAVADVPEPVYTLDGPVAKQTTYNSGSSGTAISSTVSYNSTSYQCFTLTATINWSIINDNSVLADNATNTSIFQMNSGTDASKRGLSFERDSSGNLVASAGYGNSTTAAVSTDPATQDLSCYVGDSGHLVLTLTVSEKTGTLYIYDEVNNELVTIGSSNLLIANYSDNYKAVYTNSLAGKKLTGGTDTALDSLSFYNKAMSQNEVRALYGLAAIPEPATATLSLLALAGIAARRRRK